MGSVSTNKKDSKLTVSRFSNFLKTAIKEIKEATFPLINFAWRSRDDKCAHTNKHFVMRYESKIFIEKNLCSLKREKATGKDSLAPGLLKDCEMHIETPLCYIINLSISTSPIPTIWKHAKVSPVFKSGDSSEPGNYCPISILPVFSKILEKAIHKQLMDYLEIENLLCNQQYGFRRKRSTKMTTTLFCNQICQQMDSGQLTGVLYLDLTKAFDNIGHNILIDKLPKFGIYAKSLDWLLDYLFNRSQTVEINGCRSVVEPVASGVPQGSILELLLFIIFYNDFLDHIQSCEVIMYADDTMIF